MPEPRTPTTALPPPRVPKRFTATRKVQFWGATYDVTPALVTEHMGDGRQLLAVQPLNTRPNYYLIRVDSWWGKGEDDIRDHMDDIVDAIIDEYSDIESEREYLIEDGIAPEDADLAGHEDRLGWPVVSLDSGYSWWTKAVWNPKTRKWEDD